MRYFNLCTYTTLLFYWEKNFMRICPPKSNAKLEIITKKEGLHEHDLVKLIWSSYPISVTHSLIKNGNTCKIYCCRFNKDEGMIFC